MIIAILIFIGVAVYYIYENYKKKLLGEEGAKVKRLTPQQIEELYNGEATI
jgi:hypothetical protein